MRRKDKKAIVKMFSIKIQCPDCGIILVKTNFKEEKGRKDYFICFPCKKDFPESEIRERCAL